MKLFSRFIYILSFLIICLFVVIFFSYSFLSYRSPVSSNTLLIEAWLSSYELETAVHDYYSDDIKRVIVIGRKYSRENNVAERFNNRPAVNNKKSKREGRPMFTNSLMVFNPDLLRNIKLKDTANIIVSARGWSALGKQAHLLLFVNDQFIGDYFVSDEMQKYSFELKTNPGTIKSLSVCFDNDLDAPLVDRNLFVQSVQINDEMIIADQINTHIIPENSADFFGFESEAELTGQYLRAIGVEGSKISTISFSAGNSMQTLTAAKVFSNWLKENKCMEINLVSSGVHSRRTWFTYNKIVGDQTETGIICVNKLKYDKNNWWKSFEGIWYVIDEFFSYFFNWIVLSFG